MTEKNSCSVIRHQCKNLKEEKRWRLPVLQPLTDIDYKVKVKVNLFKPTSFRSLKSRAKRKTYF